MEDRSQNTEVRISIRQVLNPVIDLNLILRIAILTSVF